MDKTTTYQGDMAFYHECVHEAASDFYEYARNNETSAMQNKSDKNQETRILNFES